MDFWQAIRNLIQGERVSRAAWNETDLAGSYLEIMASPKETGNDVFIVNDNVKSQTRFTPSEDDILAKDWGTL